MNQLEEARKAFLEAQNTRPNFLIKEFKPKSAKEQWERNCKKFVTELDYKTIALAVYPNLLCKVITIRMIKLIYGQLQKSRVKDALRLKRKFDEIMSQWDHDYKLQIEPERNLQVNDMLDSWLNDYGFQKKMQILYYAYQRELANNHGLSLNLADLISWACTMYQIIWACMRQADEIGKTLKGIVPTVERLANDYAYRFADHLQDIAREIGGIGNIPNVTSRDIDLAIKVIDNTLMHDPFDTMAMDAIAREHTDDDDCPSVCANCDKYPCKIRKKVEKDILKARKK